MKIADLRLLEIDVMNGENIIYNGKCEEAPEELQNAPIEVIKMDGKTLILKLTDV